MKGAVHKATRRRAALVVEARDVGLSWRVIAEVLGVSVSRVKQIDKRARSQR